MLQSLNRFLFVGSFALALVGPSTGCARADYLNDNCGATTTQTACPLSFSNEGLCAAIQWNQCPSSTAENTFQVKFFDPSTGTAQAGPYVDPSQTVFVLLWMPSMGHGSSPVTLTRSASGTFDVTRAYFIMPGDWQVRVQLKNGATVVDEANSDVTVP